MKILITENQLEKVINSYLSQRMDGAKIGNSWNDYNIWYSKTGKRIFQTYNKEKIILESEILFELMDVFGMDENKSRKIALKYIRENILNKK